jgi:uncharacterized protein (TIGR04255 family)
MTIKLPVETPKSTALLEAVFEIRWELHQIPNTPVRRDPAYPLLYGRLYDRLSKDYPMNEDLPSIQAHPDQTPYVVRHRIRKEATSYPLIQVGPGILTVNHATSYSWKALQTEIGRAFDALAEFYPAGAHPLNILKVELRYINGFFYENISPESFLSNRLKVKIELPKAIASKPADGVALNIGYDLESPKGQGMMSFNVGQADNKPAILQQTLIQSLGDHAPQERSELDKWLTQAHTVAKNWFSAVND